MNGQKNLNHVAGDVMKNNKKVLVALGLVLSILGSVCNKTWAMEQPSQSSEIVQLHKVISEKFIKGYAYNSLLNILGGYDYNILINDQTIDTPENVASLIIYVSRPNFLQKTAIAKLSSLKALIKTLHDIAETIQKQESAVPGTINLTYQEGYNGIIYILPTLQRLFDLIQNASGVTDQEINKALRYGYEA